MPLAVRSPFRDEFQNGLEGFAAVVSEAEFLSLEARFISL